MPILNVYKPKGLTPLQTISLLRKNMPEYEIETIGFAGRLDPLAHGVLLLMVGEETTKQRETYLNLPKEYEFECVFDVSTDTYDVLGMLQTENSHPELAKRPRGVSGSPKQEMLKQVQHDIETFIKSKLGKQIQTYPPYSSKTVNGKALYQWAREDKLHEIKMPTREIEIYDFQLIGTKTIRGEELKKEIFKQIDSVSGDFRQKEIKKKWEVFFSHAELVSASHLSFQTARFRISCSSGTYVRSLVHELGEYTGLWAIALEILRTKVGKYSIKDSLQKPDFRGVAFPD